MAIAYRSGSTAGNASGGNLSVNKPSGVVDGDILVAVLYREAGTWTLPSGWAQWGSDFRDDGSDALYLSAVWKRASSEGSSYIFELSTTTWRSIAMGAFSGCIGSGDPANTGPTGYADAFAVVKAESITPTEDNCMLVVGMGNWDGADVGASSSGYNQGAEIGGTEIWYLLQGSAAATGQKSFTSVSSSGDWATFHLALKPAAVMTLEQEGYRFRNDDGSESTATWLADQDTNITRRAGVNVRLRVITNITGDY
jgi:hypothetical protein